LLEAPRALTEASTLIPARKLLRDLPPGDGHPVLTLPGFLASDRSTRVLRRYIYDWGYDSFRWQLGRNLGPTRTRNLDQLLAARLEKIYKETGKKVSLLGWSLGGIYARELARLYPELVRCVITLGSPHGDPKSTNAWRLYEALSGISIDDESIRSRVARLREPLHDIPITAIFSKSDAIVSHKIATLPPGERVENIGISTSHIGMGFNPFVLYLIADRLRLPEGQWAPFELRGLRNFFYHI
jgi:pimeloyl-ACP methyl ester carboxylesterase